MSFILGTFLNIGFFLSLGGGVSSFLVMLGLKKIDKFSIVGISVAGAFFHSAGQLVIASIFMDVYQVFYFFPYFIVVSIITGLFVGFIAGRLNVHFNVLMQNQKKDNNDDNSTQPDEY